MIVKLYFFFFCAVLASITIYLLIEPVLFNKSISIITSLQKDYTIADMKAVG